MDTHLPVWPDKLWIYIYQFDLINNVYSFTSLTWLTMYTDLSVQADLLCILIYLFDPINYEYYLPV